VTPLSPLFDDPFDQKLSFEDADAAMKPAIGDPKKYVLKRGLRKNLLPRRRVIGPPQRGGNEVPVTIGSNERLFRRKRKLRSFAKRVFIVVPLRRQGSSDSERIQSI